MKPPLTEEHHIADKVGARAANAGPQTLQIHVNGRSIAVSELAIGQGRPVKKGDLVTVAYKFLAADDSSEISTEKTSAKFVVSDNSVPEGEHKSTLLMSPSHNSRTAIDKAMIGMARGGQRVFELPTDNESNKAYAIAIPESDSPLLFRECVCSLADCH